MWRVLTRSNASILALLTVWAGLLVFLTERSRLSGFRSLLAQEAATQIGAATDSEQGNLPEPIVAQSSPEDLATRVLHIALHQAVWGPPAWCEVRQQMNAYGQQINCFGKFVRAGQGSGKLNLNLQFPAGDAMNTLIQISDGQRLQTVESFGGERRRTIVDLDKVRSRLVINEQSIYDPTIAMYLAIGGQAESLRKLCQQYEWYSIKPSKFGEHDVWVLRGRLAEVPPNIRAIAATDLKLQAENQSGLLPTEVRVVIGKAAEGALLPYWLYQVEHRRSVDDKVSNGNGASLRLVTEWAKPKLFDMSGGDDFFELATTNEPLFEETEEYLPPQQSIADQRLLDPNSLNAKLGSNEIR